VRHMPPSALTTRSAAKRARWAASSAGNEGLPISSSPSKTNVTSTGTVPSVAKYAATTSTAIESGALSSLIPRA
jgi:hypothetical protein